MEIVQIYNEQTMLVSMDHVLCIFKQMEADQIPIYKNLQKISNPHIATVLGTTVYQNHLYAVREYVKGQTLETHLQESGPLTETEAISLVLQVCDGLKDLHQKGLVHRDVTPNNIILMPDKQIKLIDFAISRIVKEGSGTDTQILGTQGFAAPEQYGFHQTTNKSDIYAVGVLLNYCLTGSMPNQKTATGPLQSIIQKCTQIDDNQRYPSVEDLSKELVALQTGVPVFDNRKLPGFRHNICWHKAVATIYYIISGLLWLGLVFVASHTFLSRLYTGLAFGVYFYAPVIIWTDFRQWVGNIPFIKNGSRGGKILFQGVLTIFFLFLGSIFIVLDGNL